MERFLRNIPAMQSRQIRFGSKKNYKSVLDGLKEVYKQKLLPLEKKYLFHDFHSPKLNDQDFLAKPMVMLIGQYSTGKTTLAQYLIGKEFPGSRIGPEPTTDKFFILMKDGEKEGIIPGNALITDHIKQFKPLTKFGNNFLNKFQCSLVNSPVLDAVSLVDTPGILAGDKNRIDRGFDFIGVLEWFAERVDRILLLFDANKLDISDEFRRAIVALRGNDDKVRIILNKADSIDQQSLMRVYGALMWSLGKVMKSPEVARVFFGSFWDKPLVFDANRRLFENEEQDLINDIQSLPKNSTLRKLNDLNKRARLALVHAHIIGTIHKEMPFFFGRDQAKHTIIQRLDDIFFEIQKDRGISPGDFPDLQKMQSQLYETDFNLFTSLDESMVSAVEEMMFLDISEIMSMIPVEDVSGGKAKDIQGGVFSGKNDVVTPFGQNLAEGVDAGRGEPMWVVESYKPNFDNIFYSLKPINGKLLRSAAKEQLVKSKLPNSVLVNIWNLADIDKDGLLDIDEFALAMYLTDLKVKGHSLPPTLPDHLIPPSKVEKSRFEETPIPPTYLTAETTRSEIY